jgi:ATP-dependent protease ClpP protease subunit
MKTLTAVLIILMSFPAYAQMILFDAEETLQKTEEIIQKTIAIENDAGYLSPITSISSGHAHMVIYGYLDVQDYQVWNDLAVLKERGVTDLSIMVNSDGGSIEVAFAVIGQLLDAEKNGFNIDIMASGTVASAAVPIFVSLDNRKAVWGTFFMVHESSASLSGTMSDHKSFSIYSELMRDRYFELMMDRTKIKDRKQWEEWERQTKWFTLEEAIEVGIVPSPCSEGCRE